MLENLGADDKTATAEPQKRKAIGMRANSQPPKPQILYKAIHSLGSEDLYKVEVFWNTQM